MLGSRALRLESRPSLLRMRQPQVGTYNGPSARRPTAELLTRSRLTLLLSMCALQIAWAAGQVKSAVSAVLSFVTPKAPEPAPAPAPAEPSFNAASIIIPTFVAGVALYAYTTTPEGQETVKKVMAASKSAAAKAAAQAQKGVQQLKQAAAQLAEPKSKPAAKPAAKAEAPKKAAEPEKKSQPAAPKVNPALITRNTLQQLVAFATSLRCASVRARTVPTPYLYICHMVPTHYIVTR